MNTGPAQSGNGGVTASRRTVRTPRQASEPAPSARPKVVLAILSLGVLAVMVVVFSAFSTRSARDHTAPPVEVTKAGEPELAADVVGNGPTPAIDQPGAAAFAAPAKKPAKGVEEQWGIQITGMRVALGGNGLDLRYKVIDPVKATNLLHLKEITYVVDQESGKALALPFQRENQTSQKLVAGKTYFALLSNKGQVVKPGSKVTVAIGNNVQRDVLVE